MVATAKEKGRNLVSKDRAEVIEYNSLMSKLKKLNSRGVIDAELEISEGDISRQLYTSEELPSGVVIVGTRVYKDEHGGHLMEAVRLKGGRLEVLLDQKVKLIISEGQVNSSVVKPSTERFGHIHRDQDELWMVARGVLTVAMFDARKKSPSEGLKSKLVLAAGSGVYIPHGIVHGLGNYSVEEAWLIYFASHQFNPGEDTQEWRFLPQDPDFWGFAKPEKT